MIDSIGQVSFVEGPYAGQTVFLLAATDRAEGSRDFGRFPDELFVESEPTGSYVLEGEWGDPAKPPTFIWTTKG